MKIQRIKTGDTELAHYIWNPFTAEDLSSTAPNQIKTPKGIVQLSHGMAEHLSRYQKLAEYLNSLGFIVHGADHRGHGKSLEPGQARGDFGHNATWNDVVEDLHQVRQSFTNSYPELPYYILGHSMGSFILRNYLAKYGSGLSGAIIVGTGTWPGIIGESGLVLATILSKISPLSPAKFLNTLAFSGYNKGFEKRTNFDWLSRDQKIVDAYIADPLCGFLPPNRFFREIFDLLKTANAPETFKLPTDIPLFIISGSLDPVGGETAVQKIAEQYRNAGVSAVEHRSYASGRHEILNELNYLEVFSDIGNWLQKCQ
ncbi:MAG: alpha/beta hydrolase [Arcanobacterium sp.]|nr:alpha/beta hydrolase [Arcanobacterium sp.]